MSAFVKAHFNVPKGYSSGKLQCRHCIRYISGSLSVTSNFVSHMKKVHNEEYVKTKKPARPCDDDKPNQDKMTTFINAEKPKYKPDDLRQVKITEALAHFVAGDLLPLSLVESENFRKFMDIACPQYQVPSRKHFSTRLIYARASEIKQNIMHQLKAAQCIYLTMDLWSNRLMKAYIGITVHYILESTLKSVMLSCSRFKGAHTGERIRQEYEEVVACYGIADKALTVVTDNASNMVKSFSMPGFEDDRKSDSDSDDDEMDLFYVEESTIGDIGVKHARCFAHTLQLCVKDGIKECGSHVRNILGKTAAIVSHVRKSIHATEILEEEKRLQAANITRWNSQLTMIRSVLAVNEEKLADINFGTRLSPYDRGVLKEICEVLEPFEKATLHVQSSGVTGSLVIPLILGIQGRLEDMNVDYTQKLITELKRSVATRLVPILNEKNYIQVAILDPRVKNRWCTDTRCDEAIEMLKVQTACINSDDTTPPKKKQRLDLFGFMEQNSPRKMHTSGDAKVSSDIEKYLDEDKEPMEADPIQYWTANMNRYPKLASIAIRHLALPASSAAVERLFSVAGKTFRPDRCRLSDRAFEALMMIKANAHIE